MKGRNFSDQVIVLYAKEKMFLKVSPKPFNTAGRLATGAIGQLDNKQGLLVQCYVCKDDIGRF